MATENEFGAKVDFTCPANAHPEKNRGSQRRIRIAIAVLVVSLLAVATAGTLTLLLKKKPPTRLVEVNLEEGDTMVYEVDQDFEVREGEAVQKGSIVSMVAIRVLNKTVDEYWFVVKVNITYQGGDADVKGFKSLRAGLFLARLLLSSSAQSKTNDNSEPDEMFDVYGPRSTDGDFIRFLYGILYQLLPVVRRDLYENIDGLKDVSAGELAPEKSPLLPGDVKMHREASTLDKDAVFIKNHFNRSDLLNISSSEIDLDLTYTDHATINKTSGMVSESHVTLTEQLYLGEPMHTQNGSEVTMISITLLSHVALVESHSFYFGHVETKSIKFLLFAKLTVPNSEVIVDDVGDADGSGAHPSNASNVFTNYSISAPNENVTQPSVNPLKRSRRSSSSQASDAWRQAEPIHLSQTLERTFTAFERSVIGINIKAYGKVWLAEENPIELGGSLNLQIGSKNIKVWSKSFKSSAITEGRLVQTEVSWPFTFDISVPVFWIRLGIEFKLELEVNTNLGFPSEKNSLDPVKFAVELEPYAAVTTFVNGYISLWFIRAGAVGSGTVMQVSFPITLSYDQRRSSGRKWCLDRSTEVSALRLNAYIYYQWCSCWCWCWGRQRKLYDFGTTDGITNAWSSQQICSF